MSCNWSRNDYFALLLQSDKRASSALEMLVDDLHLDKEGTIRCLLCHSGSEDFLWGLARLIGNKNFRVAGNAAYIIGTVAESELGCCRVLGLAGGRYEEGRGFLHDLTTMLSIEDCESVMNAAGTIGTLAETPDGREWILNDEVFPMMLSRLTFLLTNENLWTASNAALVLARLTISEEGCAKVVDHPDSQTILSRLILSLGVDEAGRGMNAAFAIGRLCDMEHGRNRLLKSSESERMFTSLSRMLMCDDMGASKNACFALSCLATSCEGHARLLNSHMSSEVLRTLARLLKATDSETGWFAAMTLHTLAAKPRGCLHLREHPDVIPALESCQLLPDVSEDFREEVTVTREILRKLETPAPPNICVQGAHDVEASWTEVKTQSGFAVTYLLYDGSRCVYSGQGLGCHLTDLRPNTPHCFKLRAHTEGDESPLSEGVTVTTHESVPDPPTNLCILGSTITQLKLGWESPENPNGALKGYYIYNGDKLLEHTSDCSAIITGLQPNTHYKLEVCAATCKGKGVRAVVEGCTPELGAHAPSKPEVTVLGRSEMHVSWHPPELPLGKINRYDLTLNGKVVYSGPELNCTARRLEPKKEYTVTVFAITNEGKFESKPTKKRTSKDEYDTNRPPLYPGPKDGAESRADLQVKPQTKKTKKSSSNRSSSAASSKLRTSPPLLRGSAQKVKSPMHNNERYLHSRPASGVSAVSNGSMGRASSIDGFSECSSVAWVNSLRSIRKKSAKPKVKSKKKALTEDWSTKHIKDGTTAEAALSNLKLKHTKFQLMALKTHPVSDSGSDTSIEKTRLEVPNLERGTAKVAELRRKSLSLDLETESVTLNVLKPSQHILPPCALSGDMRNEGGGSSVSPRRGRSLSLSEPKELLKDLIAKDDWLPNSASKITPRRDQLKEAPRRKNSLGSKMECRHSDTTQGRPHNNLNTDYSKVDPVWLTQAERFLDQELSRRLSTLHMTLPPSSDTLSQHSMGTDVNAAEKSGGRGFQLRASTLITRHRPVVSKSQRSQSFEGSTSPQPLVLNVVEGVTSLQQWPQDMAAPSIRAHGKFVPTQFRTQPVNMPSVAALKGSKTSPRVSQGGSSIMRRLGALNCGPIKVNGLAGDMESASGFNINPDRLDTKQRCSAPTGLYPLTQTLKPVPLSPNRVKNGSSPIPDSVKLNPKPSLETSLQSAR